MKPLVFTICMFTLFTAQVWGDNVYNEFPKEIEPKEKYVFYSHGLIVEGDNQTPIHGRWGVYDFPAIKQALGDESYHLIAYHRPKNTQPYVFAKKLADDVKALHSRGVPFENITVLGFSRGGEITAIASHYVASTKLNTIILAACAGILKQDKAITVYGNVKSIYETSDSVGSCQFLVDRSSTVTTFEEIAISTAKEHGAFYQPLPQWMKPLKQWLKTN